MNSLEVIDFKFSAYTASRIGLGFFKYALSPEKGFIEVNKAFLKILGYGEKDDLNQLPFQSFFNGLSDRNKFFSGLEKDKEIDFFETRFKRKNGSKIWVLVTASLINDERTYIEGVVEDITVRKTMEDKLSLERDLLQNLLDSIPDAVYFKDKNNRIVKVNKFYARGVGLSSKEIMGKTDFDFFPFEQAKKMFADDSHVIRTGKSIVGKIERTLLPDGSWNQVITTKIPMYSKSGRIIGSMGITRDMTSYAHIENERLEMVMDTLQALTKALELKDPYTFSHARRVADLTEHIAKKLRWGSDRILALKLSAELHDIGKISIPTDILSKPGTLTDLEYKMVQSHVENCYHLLKDVRSPFPLARIIYQHHERLDGSGYPQGISGEEILPEAKILAISDVLEAMTHHRPYRQALGLDKALEELKQGAGRKYDADMVNVVFSLLKDNNYLPFWINS